MYVYTIAELVSGEPLEFDLTPSLAFEVMALEAMGALGVEITHRGVEPAFVLDTYA